MKYNSSSSPCWPGLPKESRALQGNTPAGWAVPARLCRCNEMMSLWLHLLEVSTSALCSEADSVRSGCLRAYPRIFLVIPSQDVVVCPSKDGDSMTLSKLLQCLTTLVVKYRFTVFNWNFPCFKVLLCGTKTPSNNFILRLTKSHHSRSQGQRFSIHSEVWLGKGSDTNLLCRDASALM